MTRARRSLSHSIPSLTLVGVTNPNCICTMHHSHLKSLVFAAIAVAALFASAPSALAQGITTSALNGSVMDKQGKPVAGATVTVTHEPSGTKASTTTRANGSYNLSGLRVGGPYTVVANGAGFQPETQREIYLDLGESSERNFTLGGEVLLLDTFAVTGSRDTTFGGGKIGTASNYTSNEIENTPSVRRNIQDVATLDSRITILSLDQGGQMSASGQNLRYNSFLVDGVQAIDPFGLNGNGFSSLRSPIPLEAIASLGVELTPYDVRRAGFTGALLNAVIKSGTNEFHGSVYGEQTKQNWRAVNPVTGIRDTFDEKTWGLTLGGPIIRDRLFFFGAYDNFERTAAPPTQNFVPDPTALAAIIQRAKDLGYEAGNTTAVNKSFQKTTIGKVDWNISDQHRLSLTYRKNEGQDTNFAEFTGTTTVSLSNYWYQQPRVTTSYTGQLFSNWTPNFSTELTYASTKYDGSPKNNGAAFPRVQVSSIAGTRLDTGAAATGSVVLGTENSRQLNFITTQEDLAKFTGEYSFGDHTMAFGVEDDVTKYNNQFVQNIDGNYTFTNLAGWQAGNSISSYTLAKLNPGFTLGNAFALWKYDARAVFVEDTWRPSKQLTLLAGLRYDYPHVPEAPPVATGFQAGFGMRNDTTNDGNATLAPRIGFSYELKTARKTQIRGGIGLFQGKNPAVWISNAYSNSGALGNVAVSNPPGLVFQPDPNAQVAPAGSPPAPNINVTNPGLKQPVSWKGNLAVDHHLPFGGLIFTAEFSALKVSEGLNTTFLNYTEEGVLPDGRIHYGGNVTPASNYAVTGITSLAQAQAVFGTQTAITNTSTGALGTVQNVSGYNATTGVLTFASSNANGRKRVNTGGPTGSGFADVFYLTNTKKGEAQDYTFTLRRPMKDHWSWSLSYNRNHSTEVSPMTSSTASSNYSLRASVNPNEDVASTSNYQIKDRIVATLVREFQFIKKAPTTVALVYQGRTGRPYSFVFKGDANGDGYSFNDLFYMPNGPSDPKVAWASTTERDAFFAFANATDLVKYAGGYVPRNSEVSPWMQTIDLKLTQQIPLYPARGVRAELYVNILNIANWFKKSWGIQDEVPFSYRRAVAGSVFNSATNQWVYTYNSSTYDTVPTTVNDTPISRWQVQAGMRLRF
jgi:hypothetical protein